ncbi:MULTISPECIES: translesion DNA synthesis-associated protein ImuA [Paraburkholderia]|uniref:translesion DNA synthesis-associated protein ImuA n=1 Tax=Paraburkholderia TaxID=1822464 RepID=UPI002250AD51|nr:MULTISPECIES: translesion DNA synthesis-associated protein ImuA [Paraburkholderia]MCX4161567.1 translesion DNA synthesis-associated protein ImuA [Paraburkholderia megapolitana]MDN7157063.1 translesion DNA synthesis-associated protein ImuA [Paraburkholderia sp. CHISQ3]MDQ6494108.1 translesion DNA synthesis-associated protein ImuA [Paraburkholderia megapolitana]
MPSSPSAFASHPEDLHPSLWRASQLARHHARTLDTGYAALSAELPGGGWPVGALIDLLVQQAGVGEMRLLAPALGATGGISGIGNKRPIALVRPPHVPNGPGLDYIGVPLSRLMLVKAAKTVDALWAAEQILRAGSCGALLFWGQHVQTSSLRRLHLAAQSSDTLFVMIRPLAAAKDASPALLRLALRACGDGLSVDIVKRRGPLRTEPLSLPLQPTPVLFSRHARTARRPLAPVAARGLQAEVAA